MSTESMFFTGMRKYFVCFVIFGLWTVWNNQKYKCILQLYSAILMTLTIFSFICVKHSSDFNELFENVTLSTTVATLLYFVLLLAHLVIAFESMYKSKAQEKLIQTFSIVDQMFSVKMSTFNILCNVSKRKLFICNIFIISVILCLKIPIIIYSHCSSNSLRFVYPSMYSSWIVRLRSVQVLFFVILIRNRLILMNKELINIQNEINKNHSHRSVRDAVTDSRRKLEKYIVQQKIMCLKEIYGILHDACELINDTFGWSLLAIFMQSFISFTSNCYWIFFFYGEKESNIGLIAIGITFLIQNIFSLSILAFYCSSCFQCVRFKLKYGNYFFSGIISLWIYILPVGSTDWA